VDREIMEEEGYGGRRVKLEEGRKEGRNEKRRGIKERKGGRNRRTVEEEMRKKVVEEE
jgi:hypothetical protein